MQLRILVADDHEALRIGVRSIISKTPDWQVCGEATSGEDAIAKVQELRPDVVILDVSMPTMTGFEAAANIRLMTPGTKIILFSIHDIAPPALDVLADAFVCKSCPASELIATIERVVAGSRKVA